LQKLINELNLENNVYLLGSKTHEEITDLLYNSHLLLSPSVTDKNGDQEGIPNSIKEALATGVTVIGTWHSGIPEIIINEETGLLVPEKNSISMAEKIKYFITNPEISIKLTQNGRELIEKYYDMKKTNNKLINIYEQAIEK